MERIRSLEEEMQVEVDKKRDDFRFVIDEKRARFSEEVAALQRGSKIGLWRYITGASLASWLVAPIIYSGFIPFLLLDAFLLVFQGICFPVYGITKAKRSVHRGARPWRPSVPQRASEVQLLLLRLRQRPDGLRQRSRGPHGMLLISASSAHQGRAR